MTKKLKLNVETLCVDSFETAGEREERGTVQGHDGTGYADSCGCSVGCPATHTCIGANTVYTDGPGCANNPFTVIVW